MKLSVALQTPEVDRVVPVALLTGTLEEKLKSADELGLNGVELMTVDPAALEPAGVRESLDANGLAVSAVGSGAIAFCTGLTLLNEVPERRDCAMERLVDLIRFASGISAPLVTIGSFRGQAASIGSRAEAELADMLRDAATIAGSEGVRLAVEPLNRYETDIIVNADQAMAFAEGVGHTALGILLDTYHMNIEEASWTAPLRRVAGAGLLYHVHIGENNRLPPGRGLIDFGRITSVLKEVGYEGYLSAELLAKPDPDTAARQTAEHMLPLIRQ
jgi:sugar phosphate isomerase/epimerase